MNKAIVWKVLICSLNVTIIFFHQSSKSSSLVKIWMRNISTAIINHLTHSNKIYNRKYDILITFLISTGRRFKFNIHYIYDSTKVRTCKFRLLINVWFVCCKATWWFKITLKQGFKSYSMASISTIDLIHRTLYFLWNLLAFFNELMYWFVFFTVTPLGGDEAGTVYCLGCCLLPLCLNGLQIPRCVGSKWWSWHCTRSGIAKTAIRNWVYPVASWLICEPSWRYQIGLIDCFCCFLTDL